MGVCFLYGNGGCGEKDRLNFRVFGGLTAPESPKENDIWVKTSLAIPNGSVFFNEYISTFWLGVSNGGLYIPMVASNSGLTQSTGMNCVVGTGYLAEFNVNLIGCQQKVDGAWKSRDAWIWHGSQWHQFSKSFSATIMVTYPAGSVCTVSNGSTTYTAPDTTGTWSCIVDSTGSWTVTTTKGSQSASSVVSITSDGQSASVSLSYDYVVFRAGGSSDYSGGWTAVGYETVTKVDSEGIKVYTASSWNGAQVFSSAAFDVSNYSKLNINVTAYNSARPEASFGLSRNKPANQYWNTGGSSNKTNCAATLAITSTGVKTLDISSLSGSFYFWTGEDGAIADYLGYTIGTIWLS